jgi:hypothetical protein
MSIILDALRRGRGRATPRPATSAQTDAVLQTLGYGRLSPTSSPSNRLKRMLRYVAVGVALAIALKLLFFTF